MCEILICIFMLMTQFTAVDQLSFKSLNLCRKPLLLSCTHHLKLIPNADKTKLMLLSNSRKRPQMIPSVFPLDGNEIQVVMCINNWVS